MLTNNLRTVLFYFWSIAITLSVSQADNRVVPHQLEASSFQTSQDLELIRKFEAYQIPMMLRKVTKSDEVYIVPWLRKKTGDIHDYQLTIETMRRGVMVTNQQFAWVQEEVKRCAEILNLSQIPLVFIV